MLQKLPYRRLVALAALYVVVLQALLLPLAVAAASPLVQGLCLSSAADTNFPAGHDTGCPCAAGCGTQCCGQGLAGSAPYSLTTAPALAAILTPGTALDPYPQAAERRPQNPRAPPAA